MPEGDTIFRIAQTLQRALGGREVVAFRTVLPQLSRVDEDAPIRGRTVERVTAAGKHLLIHFSGDLVLRSHLRMNGNWHVYRPGERWQRRRDDMRVVIGTSEWEAVGFSLPVAEFVRESRLERTGELAALGPDLLAPEFDAAAAVERALARPGEEIADVLLDQRVVAGIGNVYKSELLFECGVDPFARAGALGAGVVARLMERARAQLLANVADARRAGPSFAPAGRRTTGRMNPGEKLWVYGRKDEPCRRCGTPIAWRRQGKDARSTYWCPRCQGGI